MNILCIGNSFSVDTTWLLPQIITDLKLKEYHVGNLYVGGCSLNMHWEHLCGDAKVYKYYQTEGGEWESREEVSIAEAIAERKWDWISIQAGTKDGSRYSQEGSYENLPALVEKVRALAGPDTKIAFNMTWVGDQDKPKSEMPHYRGRLDELYRDIAAVTERVVTPLVDKVCPTGTAVQNFRLDYDGPMCRDGYHLHRGIGRYVAGLAFLKAIVGVDISAIRWTPEEAESLRERAIAAVEQAMVRPFAVDAVEGKTIMYLVRHGESEANQRDAFLGHMDLPLTERGLAQAELAAGHVCTLGVDAIYSSDLQRAYQTACATAERLGLPVKTDPNLREVDAGEWDNMTFAELWEKYPETFGIWANDIGNAGCDGGETAKQLRNRVMGALGYIARANRGKTVLVFCHGTPIRIAGCIGKGMPIEALKDIPWAANGSATTLEYENGSFRLVEYSREDYMGALVTKLPENV